MRYLLLLLTLLFCSTASACDSYEDCLKCPEQYEVADIQGIGGTQIMQVKTWCLNGAIAYKLDEISKKLDRKEDDYLPMGPMLLKKADMIDKKENIA